MLIRLSQLGWADLVRLGDLLQWRQLVHIYLIILLCSLLITRLGQNVLFYPTTTAVFKCFIQFRSSLFARALKTRTEIYGAANEIFVNVKIAQARR